MRRSAGFWAGKSRDGRAIAVSGSGRLGSKVAGRSLVRVWARRSGGGGPTAQQSCPRACLQARRGQTETGRRGAGALQSAETREHLGLGEKKPAVRGERRGLPLHRHGFVISSSRRSGQLTPTNLVGPPSRCMLPEASPHRSNELPPSPSHFREPLFYARRM